MTDIDLDTSSNISELPKTSHSRSSSLSSSPSSPSSTSSSIDSGILIVNSTSSTSTFNMISSSTSSKPPTGFGSAVSMQSKDHPAVASSSSSSSVNASNAANANANANADANAKSSTPVHVPKIEPGSKPTPSPSINSHQTTTNTNAKNTHICDQKCRQPATAEQIAKCGMIGQPVQLYAGKVTYGTETPSKIPAMNNMRARFDMDSLKPGYKWYHHKDHCEGYPCRGGIAYCSTLNRCFFTERCVKHYAMRSRERCIPYNDGLVLSSPSSSPVASSSAIPAATSTTGAILPKPPAPIPTPTPVPVPVPVHRPPPPIGSFNSFDLRQYRQNPTFMNGPLKRPISSDNSSINSPDAFKKPRSVPPVFSPFLPQARKTLEDKVVAQISPVPAVKAPVRLSFSGKDIPIASASTSTVTASTSTTTSTPAPPPITAKAIQPEKTLPTPLTAFNRTTTPSNQSLSQSFRSENVFQNRGISFKSTNIEQASKRSKSPILVYPEGENVDGDDVNDEEKNEIALMWKGMYTQTKSELDATTVHLLQVQDDLAIEKEKKLRSEIQRKNIEKRIISYKKEFDELNEKITNNQNKNSNNQNQQLKINQLSNELNKSRQENEQLKKEVERLKKVENDYQTLRSNMLEIVGR